MGLGYVKIFDDGGVRLFIQQADDKDRQRRNDEAGHDLVDAGRGKNSFQMRTVQPPQKTPAIAPLIVVRRQKRLNSTSGPKEAPKPAQA